MAGAGLIEIKRRIKSIVNTKKITKAMGLIATAKLRKTRVALTANNDYYSEFHGLIDHIVKGLEDKHPYKDGNKSKVKLYVTLTSDTGLCGGFNANVVGKLIEEMVKDKENSKVMMVGQKGKNYLKKFNFETIAEYVEIPDIPTIKEVSVIIDKILGLYNSGEVGEVNIVYTKFFSTVKQIAEVKKLLPVEDSKLEQTSYVNYEGKAEDVLTNTIPLYMKSELLNMMLSAKTSEQGSRMTAMDGATKNAGEIIDKLTLKYNRIRQGAITQEISEIVGGAEAQK